MTVSNWLTGKKHPKPSIYLKMAQLSASGEQAAPFLKLAAERSGFGLPGVNMFEVRQRKLSASVRKQDQKYIGGDAVGIPLLRESAAAGTPRQVSEKDIEGTLPFPRSLCPNPDKVVCIRVEGDSMSPLLEAGYIVAIDTSQVERQRLYGHMVAARDPDGAVTIKWFRKVGRDEMLIPQHTSHRHQPVVLTREQDEGSSWHIVGKVLWWIGMPF